MPNPSELTRQEPEPKTYSTSEAIAMMIKGYSLCCDGFFVHFDLDDGHFKNGFGRVHPSTFEPSKVWTIAAYPKEFDGVEAVRLAKETGRWIRHAGGRGYPIHWDQDDFVMSRWHIYVWDYTDMETMWEFCDEPQPPEPAKVEQVCGTCRYHHHDHCRISAKDGVTMISRQCVVGQLTKTASTDTCPEWREKPAKQG